MMVVMQYQGVPTGPRLFMERPDLGYGVFMAMFVTYLLMALTILVTNCADPTKTNPPCVGGNSLWRVYSAKTVCDLTPQKSKTLGKVVKRGLYRE